MSFTYTLRPISDRTWFRKSRQWHRFDSPWSYTLEKLEREVKHLQGRNVVIECDVREQDIRLDGMLRSNARPESPAVVVAFDSKHGPLLYRSDRFRGTTSNPGWQANVRAVALTLEALRAVDRYGATETGQQYTGFKALPAGRLSMPRGASTMTWEEAAAFIAERAAIAVFPVPDDPHAALKYARRTSHPDAPAGTDDLWARLQEAAYTIGATL